MAQSSCNASLQEPFSFAQDMKVFPDAKHDLLDLDSLLSPKAKLIRDKTRAFMVFILTLPCLVVHRRSRACFWGQ